jgi:hypothetical protein
VGTKYFVFNLSFYWIEQSCNPKEKFSGREDKNMKIFPEPNLWTTPIEWAKKVAGVRLKFWLQVFFHVFMGAITVFWLIEATLPPGQIFFIGFFLVVFIPIGYLYGIRKLILDLQKREKKSNR